MSSETPRTAAPGGVERLRRRIAEWDVWSLPRRLRLPVLLVEATALLLVVALIPDAAPTASDLWLVLALCGAALAHTEIAVRVERARRRVHEDLHVDLTSVWTFAAAVLLPPAVAAGAAALVHSYVWWRAWRPRVPLYRQLFSTATVVLASLAAAGVIEAVGDRAPMIGGPPDLLAVALALLVYTTVNSCLVAGAIAMSVPQAGLGRLFGHWDDNALEIATLSLGGLTAVALSINPWLAAYVLPPILVLHRAVLVRQLEEAANTDAKTGLLNAAAWHAMAERELRRGRRADGPRGVLVLDLDHFKDVNDAHGHVVGDRVLAAVADELRSEVREGDLAGRFGGEEFVVLVGGPDRNAGAELEAVAERIRRRVAALQVVVPTPDGPLTVSGLTVSVGGAVASAVAGGDLQSLLQVADAALYAAKRAGRNRVRMGVAMPMQSSPRDDGQGVLPIGAPEQPRRVEPPAAAR
ncbi:sensor domain-containing diguanylate cyclase [Pseudonocardia humida]|uniref:GGDEF domain-containing protein n=1 Tax=Pseudonocardia humida TaxID=2800819 RepID=A0ABT0ZYZ8_9PSEU|nr:GGDEF domain-containing protein [Pseudonocardia humida]MCO1655974.1 GGDEF domain-containing protein [Pseudonocardia humida]